MAKRNYGNDMDDPQKSMLKKLTEYKFAIIDLSLFLNTHPNDSRCLHLHNEYLKKYEDLSDNYEKTYGPLSINCPFNKSKWLELEWPWERGVY